MKLDIKTLKFMLKEAKQTLEAYKKEYNDYYDDASMEAIINWKKVISWIEKLVIENTNKDKFQSGLPKSAYKPGSLKKLKEKVEAGGYGKVNK